MAVVTEAQLRAVANTCAEASTAGDLFALSGPLGAGKSAFCRQFIRHYAAYRGERIDEVPSPTFTLVQTYDVAGVTLWHFDLYRISAPEEIWEIGFEEALAGGISLVEWPGQASDLLPERRIDIALDHRQEADLRELKMRCANDDAARFDATVRLVEGFAA